MAGCRRADRNGDDAAAGGGSAEGEQNRLQGDRIGRRQRYPGARVSPQAHR
jgi:hypothetical protein